MKHFKDLEFLRRQARATKKRSSYTGKRIGIYAGTFNPVHAGHMAFALQALKAARLDQLVFLPERKPRHKSGVEHFGHRTAMLTRAIRPYPAFSVAEFDDRNFSVQRTLPKLQQTFPDARLVLLFGSDVIRHVPHWPLAEQLLESCELVIGIREGHSREQLLGDIAAWEQAPRSLTLIESHAPDISASAIRDSMHAKQPAKGLLTSVARYARQHWLYVSLR
jgi:nicotinate-nucleotide adenylyltransferase